MINSILDDFNYSYLSSLGSQKKVFKIIEFFGKFLFLKNPHICGKNAKKTFIRSMFHSLSNNCFLFWSTVFVRSFVDLNFAKIVLGEQWPSWPITTGYASSLFSSGLLHT